MDSSVSLGPRDVLQKKEFFFLQPMERQLLSHWKSLLLNTRETHLSIHGLAPYAFEEGQESRLGL
jgi:hypothetical protein